MSFRNERKDYPPRAVRFDKPQEDQPDPLCENHKRMYETGSSETKTPVKKTDLSTAGLNNTFAMEYSRR
ncbi:MAG: hypothetical protein LBJ72_11205 [Dysgonamonadaceae bacterium]|nr:hypothetical protein [Dysgonamonadaceae bacterium]